MKRNSIQTIAYGMVLPILIVGAFLFNSVNAQGGAGKIAGTVRTSEGGEKIPAIGVKVAVFQNDGFVEGRITDEEGKFSISPLTPGTYKVQITDPIEELEQTIEDVVVSNGTTTRLNPTLKIVIGGDGGIVIHGNPIHIDQVVIKTDFDPNYIKQSGIRTPNGLARTAPGVYQRREGESPIMRGARPGGTAYYVDGVKVIGVIAIAAGAIGHMEVIHGGIPAEFGDMTGGIINITTKNPRMVAYEATPRPKEKKKSKRSKDEKGSSSIYPEFDFEFAMIAP